MPAGLDWVFGDRKVGDTAGKEANETNNIEKNTAHQCLLEALGAHFGIASRPSRILVQKSSMMCQCWGKEPKEPQKTKFGAKM